MPDRSVDVLGLQGGAVARRQAAGAGIAPYTIRSRVRSGRWQRLQRGVYAAFSGEPTRETTLWAALLRAGPDAVLSHQTAAERHGLIDEPSSLIVITVPLSRTPTRAKIPGVVIHRSDAILRTTHPAMLPPCTRVEDTVLDLIQIAPTFDDAYAWICRAVGRGAPRPSGYARPWTPARRCAGAVSLRWRWVTPEMASLSRAGVPLRSPGGTPARAPRRSSPGEDQAAYWEQIPRQPLPGVRGVLGTRRDRGASR